MSAQFGSVSLCTVPSSRPKGCQPLHLILQVISVDVPQYDSQFAAAKKANFELLNRILGGVTHNIRHVGDPLDLLGAFKSKEYSATAYYSGPCRIADTMTIKVKVVPPAWLFSCSIS